MSRIQLSTNFYLDEFECNHTRRLSSPQCEQVGPNPELVELLQIERDFWGEPITITSGHRCMEYNAACGGVRTSQHIIANAGDFRVAGIELFRVQARLLKLYPAQYGIGRYDTFTHLDVRRNMARWDNRERTPNA